MAKVLKTKVIKNGNIELKNPKKGLIITQDQNNPMDLIAQAIQKPNFPIETMERLMTLQERWEKKEAKKAFDNAMASFQGDCPVIKKKTAGGKTKSGEVAYYYAPLDAIVEQTKSIIQKNGMSYMVKTETLEGKVKVICIVKHELGHSEESTIEVPLGSQTGVMSQTQVVAAALTFAKRYAFCNAFGILTGDDDEDASSTKGAEKTDQKFESAKTMIASSKSEIALLDYRKKLDTQLGDKKAGAEHKKKISELMTLVDKKIDELQKSKTDGIPIVEKDENTNG